MVGLVIHLPLYLHFSLVCLFINYLRCQLEILFNTNYISSKLHIAKSSHIINQEMCANV